MHRLPYFFFCLLVFPTLAFSQTSQPSAPAQPASTPAGSDSSQQNMGTVRVRTDEVNVVFTVVDKDGRFVRDMKQDQFKILDNHLPPQRIIDFRAQTDLPLYVGLLIDSSNSIRDRFQFEKDAISEFLFDIIRPQSPLPHSSVCPGRR
jgi:hypothetical protein